MPNATKETGPQSYAQFPEFNKFVDDSGEPFVVVLDGERTLYRPSMVLWNLSPDKYKEAWLRWLNRTTAQDTGAVNEVQEDMMPTNKSITIYTGLAAQGLKSVIKGMGMSGSQGNVVYDDNDEKITVYDVDEMLSDKLNLIGPQVAIYRKPSGEEVIIDPWIEDEWDLSGDSKGQSIDDPDVSRKPHRTDGEPEDEESDFDEETEGEEHHRGGSVYSDEGSEEDEGDKHHKALDDTDDDDEDED